MINDSDIERLAQIGSVMDSIGISTVELAERLKAHVANCAGGKKCIQELLSNNHE